MSSRIPSPARSQGARTPRRLSTRSTRSLGSPGRSGRLSTFVDQFRDQNMESFAFSQNSVLSDNTQIEEPPRKSWWKRLDDNSRDVLMEAMSDNRPMDNADVGEELEVEVLSQEQKNFTLDLPDSSGSESIGSIVIPQRKLFTHKENVPTKKQIGKLVGPRESTAKLQKTTIEIQENVAPKKLFGEATTRKTIFPNILSTSVNKTESEEKTAPKKIFGEAPRKSIFPTNMVQPRTARTPEKNNVSVSPKASEKSVSNKNLLQHNPQPKIAFPAALLNQSPNKTSGNKTLEVKGQARSLFGNKGGKRKNMFAAFIVADAEEEVPEIEPPQVFGFSKKAEMRRRGSSTSYIEDEDWQLLPSSTMLEGSPAPVKKPKLSRITQSAHEKTQPEIYIEAQENNDIHSSTAAAAADENGASAEEENQNDAEDNQEVAEDNHEVAEDNHEVAGDNQKEDDEENQEETEDDDQDNSEEQENETEREEVETEQADQSSEAQNDEAEASEAEDNRNDQMEQNKEEINQEDKEYDEVLEQVAEMHREEPKSQEYEAKLNKSVKEIQKVMEMTKRLDNTESSIYDNETGSVLKDESQIDDVQDNTNKSKDTTKELNKSREEIKEIENHLVLQDEEENAMELTYEEDQSEHEGNVVKQNKEVEESMEQDEEKAEHNVTDVEQPETEEMEMSEQDIEAEISQQEEDEEQVDENEEEIEQDEEKSRQDIENVAEISRKEHQVSEKDDDDEGKEEDEHQVENSQQEVEVEVSQQEEDEVEEEEDDEVEDQEVEVSQQEEDEEEEEEQDEVEDQEVEVSQQEEDEEEEEEQDEVEDQEVEVSQQEVEVSQQEENEVEVEQQVEDEEEEDEKQDEDVEQEQEEEEEEEQEDEVEASEQEEESLEQEVEASEQEEEEDVESDQDAEPDFKSDQEEEEEDIEQDQSIENREIEESHEINDMDVNENEGSENEIQESPNVSHDTTGRNRKIKSPEAILQTTTNRRDSFAARRNTSVRKTKSMIQPNIEPSLRISTGTNSSAEGSGWDSHRVTKKTIRQTFGKGFTPRKSLRALVMEKSAKRQTMVQETRETMAESINFPQANSTEIGNSVQFEEDSDHEVSRRTRQTTLELYLQKVKKDTLERKKQMEIAVLNNLKAPARDLLNIYNINPKCGVRKPKVPSQPKLKKTKPSAVPLGEIPEELLLDLKAKPPKRFIGSNASWITKRLYKFLEAKLEPEFDYEARLRAEELVKTIYDFTKFIRRHDVVPRGAIHELKVEMAELRVTDTHADFYEFFHEFMPREIRLKVVPDIVNKLRLPRDGVFAPILHDPTVRG